MVHVYKSSVQRGEMSPQFMGLDEQDLVSSEIPSSYQLLVTTSRGVYSWTASGVSEIFRSGSGGVVGAKKICGNEDLLAVADSQVVVLHNIKAGMQQSYRLKGTDGRVRMLNYLKEADVLFFTTTLQNTIQSYSLSNAKLLDAAHTHPSPPTVLALSPASRILLSASAIPPTVYIQHIDTGGSPMLIMPNSSSSAVVAAAFHPERYNIFALAFADATLAIFNASYLLRRKEEPGSNVELASVKKLHSVGTEACSHMSDCSLSCCGRDAATGNVSVGDCATSITSVAFAPGSECTTISVGADGRCCVVDFSVGAAAIRSWSLGGQATSLSAARMGSNVQLSQIDGVHSRGAKIETAQDDILVAVGLKNGSVMLFNFGGNLRTKRVFASDVPVIDVEWLKVDSPVERNTECLNSRPKTPSVKLALAEAYALAKSAYAKSASLLDESLEDHTNINTAVKNDSLAESMRQKDHFSNASCDSNVPLRLSRLLRTPPAVPPRPTPRKGGKLALRHAETASANTTRSDQMKVLRPRRKTTSTIERFRVPSARLSQLGSDSTVSILDSVPRKLEAMNGNTNRTVTKGTETVDISLRKKSSIPARIASRYQSGISQEKSTSTPTVASTDTVIDWTPASATRRPLPQKPSAPLLKKLRSTYTLNTNTRHATSSQSIASDDTIIDWNPPATAFRLHEDLVSPSATTPAPVSRRSTGVFRKPSNVVTPLGPSSLNPSLTVASASKLAPHTAKQTHRKSPKQAAKEESIAKVSVSESQPGSVNLQVVFLQEMAILQEKIAKQFEGQRKWFVEYSRERDEWARKLDEENRLLREKLAKERERRVG